MAVTVGSHDGRVSWLAVFLTVAALFWVVALFAAPGALVRHGSAAAVLVFEIGARICHQRAERSFYIAGVQMPVCARCVGLYTSGALGALIAWAGAVPKSSALLQPRVRLILILAAVPIAVSVMTEWLELAQPSGKQRALLALPLGASAGWAFIRSLRA